MIAEAPAFIPDSPHLLKSGTYAGAALQTAKPSAVRSQRLCLHPPRPRRTPVTSHGIRQGVEPAAGTHSARQQKHSDCALFLRAEKLSNPAQI